MAGRRSHPGPAKLLDAPALKQKAIRLLARRDRSRAEMEHLLAGYCDDGGTLAALLDELQARGWLSEARLAAQLVHSRRSRSSAVRIRQELARHGLKPDVIAESTAGLEETDLTAALALWRRRFGQPAADRAERERQVRFLLNRGFGHGIALKVLRLAAEPDDPGSGG
ncbi:MAG: recombination regulator RecX [Burkholderiales bacterium]